MEGEASSIRNWIFDLRFTSIKDVSDQKAKLQVTAATHGDAGPTAASPGHCRDGASRSPKPAPATE